MAVMGDTEGTWGYPFFMCRPVQRRFATEVFSYPGFMDRMKE